MDAGDAVTGSTAPVALTGLAVISVVNPPDGTADLCLRDGDRVNLSRSRRLQLKLYSSDLMEKLTHGYSASLFG
jgi:hypothetical protein